VKTGLPSNPLFYLLLLLLYFLLPFSHLLAYRLTWTFDVGRGLSAFIKKKIFNREVMGYSGEIYVYAWARKNIDAPDREILKTIRDQNIVSSGASTSVALILLLFFLYTGQLSLTDMLGESKVVVLIAGAVALFVLGIMAVRLRKYLFAMATKTAGTIFAIHVVRLVTSQMLQIAMWTVALPEVSLKVWFTYAALYIIVTRIPFVPHDLIFTGVAVSLSDPIGIAKASLFALFAAIAVVNWVVSLILFFGLSLFQKNNTHTKTASMQ